MPVIRVRGARGGERQTRSARVNGFIGRAVVVVEMGSDIYLCSECRITWVYRAEAREVGLCSKTQGNCIMRAYAWNEGKDREMNIEKTSF